MGGSACSARYKYPQSWAAPKPGGSFFSFSHWSVMRGFGGPHAPLAGARQSPQEAARPVARQHLNHARAQASHMG